MGTTIGSPFYMAPEQAQGLDTLDRRADVWALGAIGYECLTGEVPFKGVNGPSILLEILTKEPVPPSRVATPGQADIPPGVDDAILGALKKTVGLRVRSAGQLADALGRGYGLDGDHRDWAVTTEERLGRAIASRLPSLMEHATLPRARNVTEASFGDGEGLGTAPPLEPSEPPRFASPESQSPPPRSALNRPAWLAPALVAAAALVAGVVLTLLFI
jgi:serine/threonine-protein kinase